MADFYSKYDTGNDTTGNGTIGNPYKTLAKSLSMASAGANNYYVMADEVQSSLITLQTFTDYSKRQRVIGTDSSGNVTGVVRRITSSSLANSFVNSALTYAWSWENIEWYGFSGYVVGANPTNQTYMQFYNCGFVSCFGSHIGTANFSSAKFTDCYWENCASTTTPVAGGYACVYLRCKFVNNSSTTGGIINGSAGLCKLIDCIFKDNSSTSGIHVNAIELMSNVIFKGCSMSSSTTNPLIAFSTLGSGYNILVSDCIGGGGASQNIMNWTSTSGANSGNNIAFWNNTGFANLITALATTSLHLQNAPISLSDNPWSDETNLVLSPTYPWRRFLRKIGEFNSISTVI